MKNRSSYAVLTRFGILGAILATLVFIASAVFADAHLEFDYPENGTDPVQTFSATDADGDEIEWSLSGVDKDLFTIEGGVLAFKDSPNYEDAKDGDEDTVSVGDQGAGDNVYKVTVQASGGSQAVEVTVTNVDEDGSVSFTQPQPQATREIEASFSDDDGETDPSWQWSMGPTDEGPWTEISGQTSAKRSPGADEVGSYLRATVTYTDSFGEQTAFGVTDNAVEARTLANAAPSFGDIDSITVNEGVDGAVGDPVVGSDADNDVLLYSIVADVDTDGNGTIDGAEDATDDEKFSIGRTTGQLSLNAKANFEAASPANADAVTDDDIVPYTVTIKATDPSGASGTGTVTVNIKDVNEAPAFTDDTDEQTTLYIAENGTPNNNLFTNMALDAAVVAYQATDPDGADTGTTYTLEGAGSDEDSFTLGETSGELTYTATDDDDATVNANFEGKPSYSLVVIASDGDGDRARYTRLGVTVKVVDNEDVGTVDISAPEPQVGSAVVATLNEPDAGVTGVVWQWFRGDDDATNTVLAALIADATTTETNLCDDDNPATETDACVIDGGTGPVYTPSGDDAGFFIHALATYTDGQGTDSETAAGKPTRVVQIADPANAAPKFPDQDLVTAGDQSDSTMRSVAENDKGAAVGEPVPADDTDLLLYSLSGDDAGMFTIGKEDGQIKTAVELNYEADDEHTVTVTATDPSGATDSITVVITVTDANDNAVISGDDDVSVDEGTTDVATFTATDEDGDDIVWGLGGVDKDAFEISEDGELAFKDAPNFEGASDADEDEDSLGAQGAGDNVYQVTVTASGGSHAVAVTVTNVDEDGSVSFDQPQPQATRNLKASFSDQDGMDMPTWQWSRGPSDEGPWTEIEGATMSARNPSASDVDNYLRATVTYTDSFGEQTASGVTDNAVEARTLANAAPSFKADMDPIVVNEGVDGAIGDPVTASDGDNDVLLYSIVADVDTNENGSIDDAEDLTDDEKFTIGRTTGQLSLKAKANFEAASPAVDDPDTNDDVVPYTVMIRATDPSSATGTGTVTVHIKDVNEAPAFTDDTDEQTTLYVIENVDTPALRQGEAADSDAAAAYQADDPDGADDRVTYILEGAGDDEDSFELGGISGALSLATGFAANFEDQPSYSLVIIASAGAEANDRTMYTRLPVTVKVVNTEDPGEVKFTTTREPQVGRPVLATLSDPDGGETSVAWKWYRGGAVLTDAASLTALVASAACDADASPPVVADATTSCEIGSASGSALYTPGGDDVGHTLHAVATYKDNIGSDEEMAGGSTERPAQESNPANSAPAFPDQDLNAAGDQSDMAMRTVAENDKGANVGEPLAAGDDDGDLLIYSLTGDDAELFGVDNDGQITTAAELDYESLPEGAKYHMVTLMAVDPSGASDSIMVQINVTDEDDSAIIVVGGAPDPAGPDCSTAAGGSPALAADCQILLNAMAELIGDGTATLNWSVDTEMGDWDGVATGIGRVYRIWLPGGHDNLGGGVLAGTIPDSFNDLDALERLTLRDNDLTGEIPDLSDLDNLEWLILDDNSLSGSVPATLGDMAELDYLYLHGNDLSGTIPGELGHATRLRRIHLQNNDLTGEIPTEIGELSRLRNLLLSGNDLSGAIPMHLGSLTNLKALYLQDNMLTGSIPAELGNIMTNADDTLRLLYLHNNMLSGDVPAELGNLVSLRRILLSGNDLMGCIPAAIIDVADDADAAGLMACPDDES